MSTGQIPIICYWGGEWIDNVYTVVDPKYMFMARRDIGYDEFISLLYNNSGYDPNEWFISIRFTCPGEPLLLPIKDDSALTFMLDLAVHKSTFTNVYVDWTHVQNDNLAPQICSGPSTSISVDHSSPHQELGINLNHTYGLRRHGELPSRTRNEGIPSRHLEEMNELEDEYYQPSDGSDDNDDDDVEVVDMILTDSDDEHLDEIGDIRPSTRQVYVPYPSSFTFVELAVPPLNAQDEGEEFYADSHDLTSNLSFSSKDLMMQAIKTWHINHNFEFKVTKNNTNSVQLKCMYKDTSNCKWRLRATNLKRRGAWTITRVPKRHTCVFRSMAQTHRHLDSKTIAAAIIHMVENDPTLKPKMIMIEIKQRFQISVTYKRAWLGKQRAIAEVYGDWHDSYNQLPRFLGAILHYNPGSVAEFDFLKPYEQVPSVLGDGVKQMKRVFWAFWPCIDGWQHSRPIIAVGATHLYGRYNGKLLIAMGYDANQQVYPLAYAVVESENTDSCMWFYRLLRIYIVRSPRFVCLVTNHGDGLVSAAKLHASRFSGDMGCHRLCMWHLENNLIKSNKNDETLRRLFRLASQTYQIKKFDAAMERLKEYNRGAYDTLTDLGHETWSLAHDGGRRYGQCTTNMVECYSGILRGARDMPIRKLVELTWYRSVTMFDKFREQAAKHAARGVKFTAPAQKLIDSIQRKSGRYNVTRYDPQGMIYQVYSNPRFTRNNVSHGGNRYKVDLVKKTCSCGKYDGLGFCSHAYICCQLEHVCYERYMGPLCFMETYKDMWTQIFVPLDDEAYWKFSMPTEWNVFRERLLPNPKLRRVRKP